MTFWKVSDTRIGCRITMQEIKDMGFEFQELSKERQKTAEFLGRSTGKRQGCIEDRAA